MNTESKSIGKRRPYLALCCVMAVLALSACGGDPGQGTGPGPDPSTDGGSPSPMVDAGPDPEQPPPMADAGLSADAGCPPGALGCACVANSCDDGLVCGELEQCRSAIICDNLRDTDICGPHQICEEGAGQDAVCLQECVDGYYWDPGAYACAPYASCEPTAPRSIATECATSNRVCVEQDGDDVCGDCLPGAVLEDGVCVQELFCGDAVCGESEYCDRLADDGPICLQRPCAGPDEAVNGDGVCAVCTRSCDVEGSTRRLWPFRDSEDKCVCETRPGYFFPRGGLNNPIVCDRDGDGWVIDEVSKPWYEANDALADDALVQNMRCDIRTIDRVALQDEYGHSVEIYSCSEGLIKDPTVSQCRSLMPLRLLESERNDTAGTLDNGDERAPMYGSADSDSARGLRGEEVNALSKACINDQADFNDNAVEDFKETQETAENSANWTEKQRLHSFSYFVELNTIHYEPARPEVGIDYGRLVIAERVRCDGEHFALNYNEAGSYDPEAGLPSSDISLPNPTYWRSCYRRRDPSYNANADRAGFDFAQWSCNGGDGSCRAEAPAHPDEDFSAPPDPSQDLLVRRHGLCELGDGNAPADGVWRGMHHHSQFKCVQVGLEAAADARHRAFPEDFAADDGNLVMNDCHAVSCESDDVDCIESRQSAAIDNRDPVLRCTARAADTAVPEPGEVGWAAVRYQPYSNLDDEGRIVPGRDSYAGSCINESAEWPYLCPSPEFADWSSTYDEAFGRYHCHGWDSQFLWADADETGARHNRAALLWAHPGQPAGNDSVWR